MTTIKDIAKATGFSITTISRALNGYPDVNETTRKKIKEAAQQLNYTPNALARGLVQKKSKTIGLLISGITRESTKDNFVYEVLCGINDCVGDYGYDLVLFSTSSSKQREKTYTQLCRERSVDGVIIMGIKKTDPYLQEVVQSNIPCVLIDIPITSDTVGYISTDHREGARKAVEHLIHLGHEKIALVNDHSEAFVSQLRLEGYKDALMDVDIPFRKEWVIEGKFEMEKARTETINLLKASPDITALFCASDLMAIGALNGAKQLKLKVPEDLSIVGFDDIVLASYVTPSLTTISQDKYEIGFSATTLLIDIMQKKATQHKVILENKLVIRYSTSRSLK